MSQPQESKQRPKLRQFRGLDSTGSACGPAIPRELWAHLHCYQMYFHVSSVARIVGQACCPTSLTGAGLDCTLAQCRSEAGPRVHRRRRFKTVLLLKSIRLTSGFHGAVEIEEVA